jgi:hypothetical protein
MRPFATPHHRSGRVRNPDRERPRARQHPRRRDNAAGDTAAGFGPHLPATTDASRPFQIQTSFGAVRSPPSSPVFTTPRGSINSNFTSRSA